MIEKLSMVLGLTLCLEGTVFAEEVHMDLRQVQNVKTLKEADSLYKIWKEEEEGGILNSFLSLFSSEEDVFEEDRYQAWRESAINYLDDDGNLQWDKIPQSPYPSKQPPAPNQPNWVELGPFGFDITKNTGYNPGVGRLQTFMVDPNNDDVFYAGTPAGGMWKSTNAGATWFRQMNNVANHGVSGIAVSKANSNIVVVVTGEGDAMAAPYGTGIYRSINGGSSWTNVKPYVAVGKKIAFHPLNSNKMLAAANQELLLSIDAGATWNSISGTNALSDAAWHPSKEDYLYYSTNSAVTQYQISTGIKTAISGLASSSGIRIETSSDASDSLYILCALSNKLAGFYIWDDVSNTITKSYTQANGDKNILGYSETGAWSSSGFTWYAMGFAVSDQDANLISAGSPLVWRSTDGGTTFTHGNYLWSQWTKPDYNHPDIHDLYYVGNTHYVISDGGVRVSTDSGKTYSDISAGISAISSYQWAQSPQDGSYQVTGLQDIGNFVKRGGDWYTTAGGDGYGGFVDVSDKTIMYFVQGGTRRSTSGNFLSGYQTAASSGIKYMSQSVQDANIMVGAGDNGLYYSTNRGVSWTNSASGSGKSVCLSSVDGTTAWGVSSGSLYKSSNKGQTWTKVNSLTGTLNDVACDSQDANVAWAVKPGGASQKVLKTIDGGATWSNLTSAIINGESVRQISHDGKATGGVYIGTSTSVFYYDDILGSWVNWSAGFPWTQVQEMDVHILDQKLRLASWGRGIWEANLYADGGSSSSSNSSSSNTASSSQILLSSSLAQSSSSNSNIDNCAGLVDCVVGLNGNWDKDDLCQYSGTKWKAKWWIKTSPPGDAWVDLGVCLVASSSSVDISSSSELSSVSISSSSVDISSSSELSSVSVSSSTIDISSSKEISSSSEITVLNQDQRIQILARFDHHLVWLKNLNALSKTTVKIWDISGKIHLDESRRVEKWLIDLGQFKEGQYFLRIKQGAQSIERKIVIQ